MGKKPTRPPSPEEFAKANRPSTGGRRSPLDTMPDDARVWLRGCCEIISATPHRLSWTLVHAGLMEYWPDFREWPKYAHNLKDYCERNGWIRKNARTAVQRG